MSKKKHFSETDMLFLSQWYTPPGRPPWPPPKKRRILMNQVHNPNNLHYLHQSPSRTAACPR